MLTERSPAVRRQRGGASITARRCRWPSTRCSGLSWISVQSLESFAHPRRVAQALTVPRLGCCRRCTEAGDSCRQDYVYRACGWQGPCCRTVRSCCPIQPVSLMRPPCATRLTPRAGFVCRRVANIAKNLRLQACRAAGFVFTTDRRQTASRTDFLSALGFTVSLRDRSERVFNDPHRRGPVV